MNYLQMLEDAVLDTIQGRVVVLEDTGTVVSFIMVSPVFEGMSLRAKLNLAKEILHPLRERTGLHYLPAYMTPEMYASWDYDHREDDHEPT